MRAWLAVLLGGVLGAGGVAAPPPVAVVVATSRGELVVPVDARRGHPALPAAPLQTLLPISTRVEGGWATVEFAGRPVRFLLDAPVMLVDRRVVPLAGGAYLGQDSLFVPLQWLAEYVPRAFSEGYRYDPLAARFEEARLAPVATRTAPPPQPTDVAQPAPRVRGPSELARRHGFRMAHKVVVDAGHGGIDPGNMGLHFPKGVNEKHVNLGVAQELRTALEQRGVSVVMTRTDDRFVELRRRAPMCREDCDIFVSIHVNSLRARSGYQRVNGLETYFLSEARTAEAERVARMENEALRYELDAAPMDSDPLGFILRDLQANEYLRESAQLADLVQQAGAAVHPGLDRGVAQAGFVVLSTARRPAILVETGFATNRSDARFLASRDGQRKLARALADGIEQYLKRYEAKILSTGSP